MKKFNRAKFLFLQALSSGDNMTLTQIQLNCVLSFPTILKQRDECEKNHLIKSVKNCLRYYYVISKTGEQYIEKYKNNIIQKR